MQLTGKLVLILIVYIALLVVTVATQSLAIDIFFWIVTIALIVFSLRRRGSLHRSV
jgi:hypothetical protein